MLRITRHRNLRISDRLAVFAALLLVVTSLAGMGNSLNSANPENAPMAAMADAAQSSARSAVKKNRGFKVSLLLIRNH